MCRLLPLWRDALRAFDAQVSVVIPLRNPLEVVASLERRHGFTPGKSYLIWLRHVLDALRDSAGLARCVVRYEALLRDWRPTMVQVAKCLEVTWPRSSAAVDTEIEGLLSALDRHHLVDGDEWLARPEIPDWVKRTYRELRALTAQGDGHASPSALQALGAEFDAAIEALHPVLGEGKDAAALAAVRRDSDAREVDRQRAWQTVAGYRIAITDLQAEHRTQLEELFRDGQAREDDRQRAWQIVKEQQDAILALQAEHTTRLEQVLREAQTREALGAAQALAAEREMHRVRRSRSWRVTEPLRAVMRRVRAMRVRP
jgi:hypothetical protein